MNIESLDKLFGQYGYIHKEHNDSVCVYLLNQGMYHGAEVVSLDGTEQHDIVERYSKLGYSTKLQHFKNVHEVEDYLFTGFFNPKTTEADIKRRYNEFKQAQLRFYGNSDIEYEYINVPYYIYKDTSSGDNRGTKDVVSTILEEMNRKGSHLIIVEAAAGFGKTCTAYELYKSFLDNSNQVKPIFTELFNNRNAKQFKYVLWSEIDKEKDTTAKQDIVIYNIKNGRIPLIIDGFDELLSKDIDSGKNNQQDDFEQVETMLSTIGELLEGEAKIVLTSRKTAIFAGAEFSEWVDSYQGKFDVVRIQIEKPEIREWLSAERYETIVEKKIPIDSISNPVLLTYLRNVALEEFNELMKQADSITEKYFEQLLNREKQRQNLSIRWEDQMLIFENLARTFADFGINGECRSFVKEMLIDYNRSKLLYYKDIMTNGQTLDELADTLTNHALLDRTGNNDYITFINDFVYGYLFGMSLIKDDNKFLDKLNIIPENHIHLAIMAFCYLSENYKMQLWNKVNSVRKRMSLGLSIMTDALLLGTIKQSIELEGINSCEFHDVIFADESCQFKDVSFVDVVFDSCIFDIDAFNNTVFTGCKFRDCRIRRYSADNSHDHVRCYGCEDYNTLFISDFENSDKESMEIEIQRNFELEILSKYFKVDGRSPKMKYISSLRKEFEKDNLDEVFHVFDTLKKRGYIECYGNNSFIKQEGISYYHKQKQA